MTYTVLKPDLTRVGLLANTGSSPNQFWDDKVTQGIADQSDSLSSSDLASDVSNKSLDLSGNTKQWIHTLDSLNVSTLDPVGAQLDVGYHVAYYDESSDHNYLMTLTKVVENARGHAKSAIGVNTAVYDMNGIRLGAKTFDESTGTLNNILKYVFANVPWNIRLQSSNVDVHAFEIKQDDSVQTVLQSVVTLFGVEVDAFIEPVTGKTSGALIFGNANAIKRVILVTDELGADKQIPVIYGRNMTSLSKTTVSDVFGTRFKVVGADDLTIESVNGGSPYLVDDVANQQHNPIGWANGNYRDLTITNNAIKDAKALLTWGKVQVEQLNHPRSNYEVEAVFSDGIALGDSIIVQDLYAGKPIVVKSRAIKIQSSQANPYGLTVTIGEFVDIARKSNTDVTSVLAIANSAKSIAVEANAKAEGAQTTAYTANTTANKANDTATAAQKQAADALAASDKLNTDLSKQINDNKAAADTAIASAQAQLDEVTPLFKDADGNYYSTLTNAIMDTTLLKGLDGSKSIQTQMANLWTVDIKSAKTDLESQITAGDSGVLASVKTVQDKVNSMGQVNQVMNSEFTPDLAGWEITNNNLVSSTGVRNGSKVLAYNGSSTSWFDVKSQSFRIPDRNQVFSVRIWLKGSGYVQIAGYSNPDGTGDKAWALKNFNYSDWTEFVWENISYTDGSTGSMNSAQLDIFSKPGEAFAFSKPMLVLGTSVGSYVPGNYAQSTSTILGLFDNRFALGIKNNQGLITSGVFGDVNGMSITGKVVTIDADSTVIKGTLTTAAINLGNGTASIDINGKAIFSNVTITGGASSSKGAWTIDSTGFKNVYKPDSNQTVTTSITQEYFGAQNKLASGALTSSYLTSDGLSVVNVLATGSVAGSILLKYDGLTITGSVGTSATLSASDGLVLSSDYGWTKINPSSNFSLFSSASPIEIKRQHGIVYIHGVLSPKTTITGSASEVTMFTLPADAVPRQSERFVMHGSGSSAWLLSVNTNRTVTFSRYSYGTDFNDASTSAWLPFSASWAV